MKKQSRRLVSFEAFPPFRHNGTGIDSATIMVRYRLDRQKKTQMYGIIAEDYYVSTLTPKEKARIIFLGFKTSLNIKHP